MFKYRIKKISDLKINMQENYSYRKGTLSDLEALVNIGLKAYGQFKSILGEEAWGKMESNCGDPKTYIQLLEIAQCFVCEYDNKVVGMSFLIPKGNPRFFFEADWAYIRLIGVLPEHGRNGIGRRLTKLCINASKVNGEKILALHTSEFQDAARSIYESLGFKKIKELDRIFNKRYWLYQLDLESEEKISYERASLKDLDALIDLRLQFTSLLTGISDPERVADLKTKLASYFTQVLSSGEGVWIIARSGDLPAATGGMLRRENPPNYKNPSGLCGYIVNIYTIPFFRRKGISTVVLNKLMEEGKKEGIHAFELHATKVGELVYKQAGFEVHDEPTYRKYI